ncbi:Uncharacterised protein [Salmonella enterica subsp. enterica serovar Bovismorbificans]|nr:Uncharacterised protein [Salmonella enterica subsp. enterica serovar Bovismorbificans]
MRAKPDLFFELPVRRFKNGLARVDQSFREAQLIGFGSHRILTNKNQMLINDRHNHYRLTG